MKDEKQYIVYKITCDVNGKVYIGQTYETIDKRFKRHMNFAHKDERSEWIKFSRAIRKYGVEHFYIEQIEECHSQEELDEREWYWINHYDAVRTGYNSKNSKGKCGGDTWTNNPNQEAIRVKLREGKLGDKNPMKRYGYKVAGERNGMYGRTGGLNPIARKCVAVHEETGEVMVFGAQKEASDYFGFKNSNPICQRIKGTCKSTVNGWKFYDYEEYLEAQQTIESVAQEKDLCE